MKIIFQLATCCAILQGVLCKDLKKANEISIDPVEQLTKTAQIAMGGSVASTKAIMNIVTDIKELIKESNKTLSEEMGGLAKEMARIINKTEIFLFDIGNSQYTSLDKLSKQYMKLFHCSLDLTRSTRVATIALNTVTDATARYATLFAARLSVLVGQQGEAVNDTVLKIQNLNVWANLMKEHDYSSESKNRFVQRLYDEKDELKGTTELTETRCMEICDDPKEMTGCRISCAMI